MDITDYLDISTYYIARLEGKLFALQIDHIREIRVGFQKDISPAPQPTPFLIGVIQTGLEGIPVVNLTSALEMPQVTDEERSQKYTIVIVEGSEGETRCGLLVENCLNIVNFNRNEIVQTELFLPYIQEFFILKTDDEKQVVKILDVDAILKDIKPMSSHVSCQHWG